MSGVDLEAELSRSASHVRKRDVDRLVARGVPMWAMQRLLRRNFVFGLDRVRTIDDGLYEPDAGGQWAMIIPVGKPCRYVDCDETIDLIAIHPDRPANCRWRIGDGWALGEHLLDHDAPVETVATPLEWMAHAGEALCVLDWDFTPQRWARLRDGPPLVTNDALLRRRLNRAFTANVPPLIFEAPMDRQARHRHAA